MEFKEVQLEEIQHQHPLVLEDLQSIYQNYLEDDDDDFDDSDLIAMQKFKSICDICGFVIDWYHRYYYKCSQSSCSYSLHKFCGELPPSFRFPAHPIHTLQLKKTSSSWSCDGCLTQHQDGICYHCSTCDYEIDLRCITFSEQTMIHHPGHPHPLLSVTRDPTLSKCFACQKEHKGVFYYCITCFNFSIHVNCVALPFKLTSKQHVHLLTLSYSFSYIPYHSKCRICGKSISKKSWLYKCSKCRYYVHLNCATSRRIRRVVGSNFEHYSYYPRYPQPDESYILKHIHLREDIPPYFGQFALGPFDGIGLDGKHPSHKHPLLRINSLDTSVSRTLPTSIHNPYKRIKLLCNGCLRPITTPPFYVCQVDSSCNFHLHEWCTRLPIELKHHPDHNLDTLVLSYFPSSDHAGFWCKTCRLHCNGFGYGCSKCNYLVDVHCGLIPECIIHDAHNHLLSKEVASSPSFSCAVIYRSDICYKCIPCNFYLDIRCALHLPKTIKNKYDKHPLKLSYSPIENHKSEYFCEVCEEELIPEKWFYHCQECGQSIHSACAPLILQTEQDVNSLNFRDGVYQFLNMKFGGITITPLHKHPVTFLAGSNSDVCYLCQGKLHSLQIFKCFKCNVSFHVDCGYNSNLKMEEEKFPFTEPPTSIEYQRKVTTFYPDDFIRPVTAVNEHA